MLLTSLVFCRPSIATYKQMYKSFRDDIDVTRRQTLEGIQDLVRAGKINLEQLVNMDLDSFKSMIIY